MEEDLGKKVIEQFGMKVVNGSLDTWKTLEFVNAGFAQQIFKVKRVQWMCQNGSGIVRQQDGRLFQVAGLIELLIFDVVIYDCHQSSKSIIFANLMYLSF